jgi:hypothetical protein
MSVFDRTDHDEKIKVATEYQPIYSAHGRPLPMPLEIESKEAYRRRLAETTQELAPNCRDFNIRHSTGTALTFLKSRFVLMPCVKRIIQRMCRKGRSKKSNAMIRQGDRIPNFMVPHQRGCRCFRHR